jgi:hypothetical protein
VLQTLVVHEVKQHDWSQLLLQLVLQLLVVLQLVLQLLVPQLSASATAGTKSARVKNILESCFIKVLLLI